MALFFNRADSEGLVLNSSPVVAYPFSMHARFYSFNTDDFQAAFFVQDKDVTSNRHGIYLRGDLAGDPVQAFVESGLGASTTTGYSGSQWHSVVAVFTSTTNREVWIDGAGYAQSILTTSQTLSDFDRVSIGYNADSTPGGYIGGRVCECAIWNVSLTSEDAASLSAGASPLLVRTGGLVFYAPLIGGNADLIGGTSLTDVGTPDKTTHHPTIYPSAQILQFPPTAAGGATVSADAQLLYSMRQLAAADSQLLSNVNQLVSAESQVLYRVLNLVAADAEFLNAIRQLASADVELLYAVRQLAAADAQLLNAIANLASADVELLYELLNNGTVSADLSILYKMAGITAADTQILYKVSSLVAADAQLLNGIRQLATADAQLLSAIKNLTTAEVELLNKIAELSQADMQILYAMSETASADLRIIYALGATPAGALERTVKAVAFIKQLKAAGFNSTIKAADFDRIVQPVDLQAQTTLED